MSKEKRDTQRAKVYRAEDEARKEFKTPSCEIEKWNSLTDCYRFAHKVVGSKWFQQRWPHIEGVKFCDGRGTRIASYHGTYNGEIRINLPRWSRTKWIILHEISHGTSDHKENASHGREFCSNFLNLVARFMGAAAATALRKNFKAQRVRYRKRST